MDNLVEARKAALEAEISDLRKLWFQQQLVIEKRKAYLETLKGNK